MSDQRWVEGRVRESADGLRRKGERVRQERASDDRDVLDIAAERLANPGPTVPVDRVLERDDD